MVGKIKWLIQIFISLSLIICILNWIDFEQLIIILKSADYQYLVLAFVIVVYNRLIMSQKWNLLLKALNIHISWIEALKVYYVSNFVGLFLPPTVGGDIVRAILVTKKKFSSSDILSSIVVERIIGVVVVFLFGICGILLLMFDFGQRKLNLMNLLLISSSFFILSLFLFILSLNDSFSHFIFKMISRRKKNGIISKIINKIEKIYSSYLIYKNQKKVVFVFFILTCAETFTVVLWSYSISLAVSGNIPFEYFLSIVPIITLLIRIPFTIAGFGVHEGSFVYFLSILGYPESLGFTIGILDHMIIILGILPGGLFLLFDRTYSEMIGYFKKK